MAKTYDIPKGDLKHLHTPKPTPTWSPISHFDVVDQTEKAIEDAGISVITSRLDINGPGTYMFGQMTLETSGHNATRFMLGFRNSTNKHMAVGFTAGLHVYVCSNMMFQGDYMTFKRHTSSLNLERVYELAKEAVGILPKYKEVMDEKFVGYRHQHVGVDTFKKMTFDMMKAGVVNPKMFGSFLSAMNEEINLAHGSRTLAVVHHGVTRLNRKQSLERIIDITPRLTNITDDYYARLAA